MGHMVIFRGGDGKPGYHQVDELSEAIHHVEHLRNNEGIDHAQIFQMEEVTFEFRPYFRVEVASATAAPMPGDDVEPEVEAEDEIEAEEVAPAPVVASWAARVKEVPADPEPAKELAEPVSSLAAMVGEPAGEPWPAHEAGAADDGALTSNGVRRGLFGR